MSFDVTPFVGNVSFAQPDVVLVGGGLVLTADAGPQPNFNVWNTYSVSLSETGSWQKANGATPTVSEFQSLYLERPPGRRST